MCEKAVGKDLRVLELVPDQYKTQEMYERAVEQDPWSLELVPDQYKKEEMCKKAVFMTEKFKKSINKGNAFKAFLID